MINDLKKLIDEAKNINITININQEYPYKGYQDNNWYNDPCVNCSNNPKNNPYASGSCCCSLPDLFNIIS